MTAAEERQEANRLKVMADTDPQDATLNLRAALALDGVSRESTAIRYYEQALHLGLDAENELLATVCLVSSYRNTKRYDEALARLKRALAHHPDDVTLNCFLSLVLLDMGDPYRALYTLGNNLLRIAGPHLDKRYTAILQSKFRGLLTKRLSVDQGGKSNEARE